MKKSYEAVKLRKVLYGEDMIRTSGEQSTGDDKGNFSAQIDDGGSNFGSCGNF